MKNLRYQITPELVTHFNRPGPRYTSYPTAPQMRDEFDASTYQVALTAADASRPLSLYVHLPFCKSLCNYCGCHMMVTHHREKIEQYLGYLSREIDLVGQIVDPGRIVHYVHWGGGTPTYLSPQEIERLMRKIRRVFHLAPDAEISIEADPRTTTPEHVRAARRAGFNRISLGVQDLDPAVQQAVGRIQPETLVRQVMANCRTEGFESISLDLIYGLPKQTPESFAETLHRVAAMDPERCSLFSYAHVPWMKKHQRLISTVDLPSPREKLSLLLLGIETLTSAGLRYVGMDHFVKPSDPLCIAQDQGRLHRNFQGYATDSGCDLIGLGVSAISQLDCMYVQNQKGLAPYYQALDRNVLPIFRGIALQKDDLIRRHVITRLMCDFVIDRPSVESAFGIDFDAYFPEAVRGLVDLEEHELVVDDGLHIRATDLGRLLVRNVAMLFDAYLPASAVEGRPEFSQTI